jgi:hypothetical protein
MVDFRHMYGAVYILENSEAQRVKIGMTINDIALRLSDVNDMWLGRRVTCQICGKRLNNVRGQVPKHPKHGGNGRDCPGGNALPLEKDIALAESHLLALKACHCQLSGGGKGSATKMINTFGKRIKQYRHYLPPVGVWQFRICFYTECAEAVELLSHEILAERLDKAAPIGEIFCCSVTEAAEAVESALVRLGLIDAAVKQASTKRPSRRL